MSAQDLQLKKHINMDANNSNLSLIPKNEHEVHRYHKMIERIATNFDTRIFAELEDFRIGSEHEFSHQSSIGFEHKNEETKNSDKNG